MLNVIAVYELRNYSVLIGENRGKLQYKDLKKQEHRQRNINCMKLTKRFHNLQLTNGHNCMRRGGERKE